MLGYLLYTFHSTFVGIKDKQIYHELCPENPALLIHIEGKKYILIPLNLLNSLHVVSAELIPFKLVEKYHNALSHLLTGTIIRENEISLQGYRIDKNLCAELPEGLNKSGKINWRPHVKEWERFKLVSLDLTQNRYSNVRRNLAEFKIFLCRLLANGLESTGTIEGSYSLQTLVGIDLILNFLDYAYLGPYKDDAAWLPILARIYGDEKFTLPVLLHQKLGSRHTVLTESLDFLANLRPWCAHTFRDVHTPFISNVPLALNNLRKYHTATSKQICIIATARNEGVYLLDFISYYRALGIQEFYIYSNNNSDGSDKLLSVLAKNGIIHYIENHIKEGSPQFKAYAHAFCQCDDILEYEWALVVDIDEYLWLNDSYFCSLEDLLAYHDSLVTSQISINWCTMGSGEEYNFKAEPVIDRFRCGSPIGMVKSISKPKYIITADAHRGYISRPSYGSWRYASGEIYSCAGGRAMFSSKIEDKALLLHYNYKSFEEFIYKYSRISGDMRIDKAGSLFSRLNIDNVRHFIKVFNSNYGVPITHNNALKGKICEEYMNLINIPEIRNIYNIILANTQKLIYLSIKNCEKYLKTNESVFELLSNILQTYRDRLS